MDAKEPLLSVCVPTFNRAQLLNVMLGAIVPQVQQLRGRVELLVSDNASTDNTDEVVTSWQKTGPIRYSRNKANLGFFANVLKLTTMDASGDYVWLLGDDDVVLPNALEHILGIISANTSIRVFYTNFRWASFDKHWPKECVGGFDGDYDRLNIADTQNKRVRTWGEFIHHETDSCTQIFSQIAQRKLWTDYWRHRKVEPGPYSLTRVFPHCVTFAATSMMSESFFIGEPVSTVFVGSQCYLDHCAPIWGLSYPQLLLFYRESGLSEERFNKCLSGDLNKIERCLADLLRNSRRSSIGTIFSFLRWMWCYPIAVGALIRAIKKADRPWIVSQLIGVILTLQESTSKGFQATKRWLF